MFQTMMIVAIPALVTLTAAFFLLRSISREEENGRGGFNQSRRRPFSTSSDQRQRNADSGRDGFDLRRRRNRRNVGSEAPRSANYGECVVCFENSPMVEIYPCRHTNVCEDCINMIICKNKRICPFCRVKIQGYGDLK